MGSIGNQNELSDKYTTAKDVENALDAGKEAKSKVVELENLIENTKMKFASREEVLDLWSSSSTFSDGTLYLAGASTEGDTISIPNASYNFGTIIIN